MRTVLDDEQLVPRRDLEDRIHVARHTPQMRRHHHASPIGNGCLERRRRQVERLGIDVGEHRRQPRHASDLRHDPEGECRNDDLAAWRQIEGLEQVLEGHAAIGRRHAIGDPHTSGECLFELRDVRALDERALTIELGRQLLRIADDAGAVAGDGLQHVTALDIEAVSPRLWYDETRRSSRRAMRPGLVLTTLRQWPA